MTLRRINGDGEYSYDLLATRLEIEFNKCLATDRNGKFEAINDIFYKNMKEGKDEPF
jgi:hypothetical protein